MIRFRCKHCGSGLQVADGAAGRQAPCPHCGRGIVVPASSDADGSGVVAAVAGAPLPGRVSPRALADKVAVNRSANEPQLDLNALSRLSAGEAVDAPPAESHPALAAGNDLPICPSCRRPLSAGARVCIDCGVRVPSGRPLLTAYQPDEDALHVRVHGLFRWLSWIIPLGIYPLYSEAHGRHRPVTTWVLAGLTIIVSVLFWQAAWTSRHGMGGWQHMLLWAGERPPDKAHLDLFYTETNFGDGEAWRQRVDQEIHAGRTPEQAAVIAHNSLRTEQQAVGRFQWYQLFTHALLHADIFHLAGNLLFLLVLGSRVNAAIGNIKTLVLYPILAAGAAWAQMNSVSDQMPGPMLGASGAVMGLAGMYLLLFPLQRVHMVAWVRLGLFAGFRLALKVFAVPGLFVVLFYIGFDVFYTAASIDDGTAHWAHLGGFMFGLGGAAAMLIARLAYTGHDVLSVTLGRWAWPLIGRPAGRFTRRA